MATTLDPVHPAPHADAPATGGPGRLPHFPALDGLRGACVAAVLLFHNGFSWMSGGFLGVSTFFTLSGFLITSLLLSERDGTGQVDLRAFWRRRVRRLMPAALAGIALALLFGLVAADGLQREQLAGDTLASLGYVANWWYVVSGQSYGELFGDPSPLLHYWSLAIEEQFYLVFPLVAWLCLTRLGLQKDRRRGISTRARGRARLTVVLVGLLAATVAIPFVTDLSQDWLYFGTLSRAPELLLGCLLALALHHRRITSALADNRRVATVLSAAGLIAAGVAVWLWTSATESSSWLYQGGFALYALLSAVVIVNGMLPGSPLRAALAWSPLRSLGVISYGVYVMHWPLFLWIDEARTGLDGWSLFAVRVAATLGLAVASYHLLEQPVRRGQRLGRLRPVHLAGPAVASLAAAAIVLSATAPPPTIDFAAAEEELAVPQGEVAPLPTTTSAPPGIDPATLPPPRPRIAAYGDSTAMMTAFGFSPHAAADGSYDYLGGIARLGCGLSRVDAYLWELGTGEPPHAHCFDWPTTWSEHARARGVNVAYVQQGPWELFDRRMPGEDVVRALGDPVYDEYLLSEMLTAIDVLTVDGAIVAWATTPNPGGSELANEHPERVDRYNELVRQLPELRPGQVFVVDLQSYVLDKERTVDLRPDDVHFTSETALTVVSEFLAPALDEGFRRTWVEGGAAHWLEATEDAQGAPDLPADDEVLRLLVWGDDTVGPLGDALAAWAPAADRPLEVRTVAAADCGIARTDRRSAAGREVALSQDCRDRTALWAAMEDFDPHAVVVVPGRWETGDHLYLQDPWIDPDHAVFGDLLRAETGVLADELRSRGAAVIVAPTAPRRFADGSEVPEDHRRAIIDLTREASLAPSRAAWIRAVDLEALSEGRTDIRPDGAVWSGPGVAGWVEAALGPALLDELASLRDAGAS